MSVLFLRRGLPEIYQWAQYTVVDKGSKGTLIGYVRSNYTVDYPADGIQDGYWYTRVH